MDPMEFRGQNLVLLSQFPSSCRKLADISRHVKRHLLQEEVNFSKNVHFAVIHRLWRLFRLHHAGASPKAHSLLLLLEMLLFLLLCSNLNNDTASKKIYSIKRFYVILFTTIIIMGRRNTSFSYFRRVEKTSSSSCQVAGLEITAAGDTGIAAGACQSIITCLTLFRISSLYRNLLDLLGLLTPHRGRHECWFPHTTRARHF